MKAWILGIVSLSLFVAVLELFCAEGKTKKLISGILRIVFVFVLLQPVFSLVKGDEIELFREETFSKEEYTENNIVTETVLKQKLKEKGIDCSVKIITKNGEIESIDIYPENPIINPEEGNIYIYSEEVLAVIRSCFDIELEKIRVYG